MFDGRFRRAVDSGVAPVGSSLGSRKLRADHLTMAGLLLAAVAAVVIATGHLLIGLFVVILAAVPDLLDGAVAKATGTASVRGAFFDSVSDRITDGLVLGGIAWHLASARHAEWALLPFAVLGVSNLISYERAKAESLGIEAKGGLMERAERIIALCVGLAFPIVLIPVLWAMLALTSVTAVQRFVKVWKQAPPPGAVDAASAAELLRAERAELRAERAALRAERAAMRRSATSRWREWREARESDIRAAHPSAGGAAAGDSGTRVAGAAARWRARRPGGTARTPIGGTWRRRDRTRP